MPWQRCWWRFKSSVTSHLSGLVNKNFSQKNCFSETSINIFNSAWRGFLEALNLEWRSTLKWCWQQCVCVCVCVCVCDTKVHAFAPVGFQWNGDKRVRGARCKVAATSTECAELLQQSMNRESDKWSSLWKHENGCVLGRYILDWIQLVQLSVKWQALVCEDL